MGDEGFGGKGTGGPKASVHHAERAKVPLLSLPDECSPYLQSVSLIGPNFPTTDSINFFASYN